MVQLISLALPSNITPYKLISYEFLKCELRITIVDDLYFMSTSLFGDSIQSHPPCVVIDSELDSHFHLINSRWI